MLNMAPKLLKRVLDGGSPNLDGIGITYIVLAIVYTFIVSGELFLFYHHRSAFVIKIRNIRVVVATVSMLHVYLILVLLVYPWNGLFPCAAEYWIMSVFLPCGMALFQACNARVLKAYESQRRLKRDFLEAARKKRLTLTPRGIIEAWIGLDATSKVYLGTVVGLIVSFVPVIILFFWSRRFHPSYGLFGPSFVDRVQCRRGPEWIPSILMQFVWTAAVGPWILWKIRKVDDVHSWAWQTRLAILAGLPGTPLWMAFTYSKIPAVLATNQYFPPAGWFLLCLLMCQQVLILIPLFDTLRSQSRRASISSSTTCTSDLLTTDSISSATPSFCKRIPHVVVNKELKPKASMHALEFSIEHSIEPLISWAASREFTAENAIFLREVRNFKKKWGSLQVVTTAQRRQMYAEASLIFFTLVNPCTAETPINIDYKIFRTLQKTFEGIEYDPYMPQGSGTTPLSPPVKENVVCPWENILERPASLESTGNSSSASSIRNIVPSQFTEEVFDPAFESIKYLVFTNTWPRYVEAKLSKNNPSPSP
ncbi:uncharacterized protein EI97DRAFT_99695 [Westerdykella ornata]|uniref:RGS domain-containing protein n=1 Tax=Westerdykella ornata TaxID=318751 RepID=A0A6A6JHN8_WESOR|nr:uncharacterized protein EI97DRAFT_99695 [Westerdykella ornata]KAF2274769.1 hypothetical protein EI97DRAFT_99695 [Westerdykella ornata]